MNASALEPTWVMCGIDVAPGQVVLLASDELTQVELAEQAEYGAYIDSSDIWAPRTFTLTTTMRRFVRITAPDWPTAFNILFARWSPRSAGQPMQVGQPTRMIAGA